MLRKRSTQLVLLLLLSAVTTVAIAAPQRGKGGGGKNYASLSVTVTPATFSESDIGAIGTVTRESSDTSVPLTVTLTSSDETEATVSLNVQIPANEVSWDFDVIAVNDSVKDGDQQVTIFVSATDYTGASTSITVVDDEGLPQIAYVPTVIPMPQGVDYVTVNDINDYGVVAGYTTTLVGEATIKHGIIYDPAAETSLIDLHDDLTFPDFDYDNWVIASVVGINNNGLAVGYAELLSDSTVRQGFVIDLDVIEIYALPEADEGWQFTYARKVNDNGDILGMYRSDADGTAGSYLVNLGLRGVEKAYPLETIGDSQIFANASLTEPADGFPTQVVSELNSGPGIVVYTQGGADVRYITGDLSRVACNDFGDVTAILQRQEEVPLKGKKTETIFTDELFLEIGGVQDYIPLPYTNRAFYLRMNDSGTVLMVGDDLTFYTSEFGFVKVGALLTSSVPGYAHSISNTHMNDFGFDGFTEIAYGFKDADTLETSLIILTPVPLP